MNETGQPVLVGTTSIEKSERLSELLKKKGVRHVVLNAKYHEREAEIVAQAGRLGAVTIATNMAGRGTDILLGGNAEFMSKQESLKAGLARSVQAAAGEISAIATSANMTRWYYQGSEYEMDAAQWQELLRKHEVSIQEEHQAVIAAGGLHILGTERHESRRVDNQLRGDPGSSRFYLSLEDDLMRIFAKEWVSNLLQRLGMEEGVPIESRLITRRIEAAQKAVEAQNFESRKHLLEYDDVMNKQREAVYGLRRQLLQGVEQKELILDDYVASIVADLLDKYAPKDAHPDEWDLGGFKAQVFTKFGVDIVAEKIDLDKLNRQELGDAVFDKLKERYESKERLIGSDAMRYHERMIMLSVLDGQWKDHLLNMDHLKEGIGLRGYGQHDPLVEYKRESFDMFEAMMQRFQEDTARHLYFMQVVGPNGEILSGTGPTPQVQEQLPAPQPAELQNPTQVGANGNGARAARKHATSLDELEREFQRKKQRELEQARMAGAGDMQVQQRRVGEKIGRNDPCPCGSGKKYKKCCGA